MPLAIPHPQPLIQRPWDALTLPTAESKGTILVKVRGNQAPAPFPPVASGLRARELGLARKFLGAGSGGVGPAETGPLEKRRPGKGVGQRHKTQPTTERQGERETDPRDPMKQMHTEKARETFIHSLAGLLIGPRHCPDRC